MAEMNFDLLKGQEKIRTENGALSYKTTANALLDASFKVPQMRLDSQNGVNLWTKYIKAAFDENPEATLRFVMYLRDIRGGLGERSAFRRLLVDICQADVNLGKALLEKGSLPEYGRWDDLLYVGFRVPEIQPVMERIVWRQLSNDINNVGLEKPISLLAKWMPSEKAHSAEAKAQVSWFCKTWGCKHAHYRKMMSKLRKYLKVIERDMSAGRWDQIDYASVPSKANILYKDAFMNHDAERRNAYLESLQKGEAKINAKALFPYEVVRDYGKNVYFLQEDTVLEELWKNLPKPSVKKNVLVVRDGSGSMTFDHLNGGLMPMTIGDSIAIYMAENNSGCYHNKFITFSSHPEIVDLSMEHRLVDKLRKLRDFADCSNTNLEAVFDLVLNTIEENRVKQEEIPDILIISDMEFDEATTSQNNEVLLKTIATHWNAHGYKFPRLIFWNVSSRTGAIPLKTNDNGLVLVSGFSTAIAEMVLSGDLDPWKALVKALDKERYDAAIAVLEQYNACR